MPDPHTQGERTPEQREADHAGLARLAETLVPALVQKLNTSGLGELEVREGDWRVRLRRSTGTAAASPSGRRADRIRTAPHALERDGRSPREAATAPADPTREAPTPNRSMALSPAVGVFRPGAQPGTRVRAGDRIGIVDLLGIPQDVVAPIDGTLVEVLVPGGEAVEYGEPIATIEADPSGADRAGDPAGGA